MGAVLCALSNIMYYGEKLAMWLAAMGILTCLVLTLLMMLGLGVGLGYNYCFVDIKSKHRYVKGYYEYELYRRGARRPMRKMSALNETEMMSNDSDYALSDDNNVSRLHEDAKVREKINSSQNVFNTKIIDVFDPANSDHTAEVNEDSTYSTSSKTIIKVDELDLMTLLSKLKAENINYTLQIVTT